MSKGRAVPPQQPTDEQQRQQHHDERRAALLSLDPALMRVWARRWGVPLIETDDAGLLESMHAAIIRDESLPALRRYQSAKVLADASDEVALALLARLEEMKEASDA